MTGRLRAPSNTPSPSPLCVKYPVNQARTALERNPLVREIEFTRSVPVLSPAQTCSLVHLVDPVTQVVGVPQIDPFFKMDGVSLGHSAVNQPVPTPVLGGLTVVMSQYVTQPV